MQDAAKIYQHLFFRFNFEPGFSFNTGPLGFDDQFLASIDAMNWFIEILNLPDEGSYQYDAGQNTYHWLGEGVDMPGADLLLTLSKVRDADLTDAEKSLILGGNAARLLRL